MLFLEEWEIVKSLENKKSETEIASIIQRGAQTVQLYKSLDKDGILNKLNNRLYSTTRPTNIKQSISVPDIYVTSKGEFIYKAQKYWYRKNTAVITSSRGEINLVSFFWKGTYYRAHRIIAEALFPDYSKDKFVLFKDGDRSNINPKNLVVSDSKVLNRCEICGKPIKKPRYCINCKKKKETHTKQKKKRLSEANLIEQNLINNHKTLKPHQRKILNYYKNGYSISEIAKITNVSRQAVSSSLQRVKRIAEI